jgi:hypothetical protein
MMGGFDWDPCLIAKVISNPSIHGEGDVMLTNKEFMEHHGIILSL